MSASGEVRSRLQQKGSEVKKMLMVSSWVAKAFIKDVVILRSSLSKPYITLALSKTGQLSWYDSQANHYVVDPKAFNKDCSREGFIDFAYDKTSGTVTETLLLIDKTG